MVEIQELLNQHDFFEKIYQSVPCGILHTIDNQKYTGYFMNEQGAKILGFSSYSELIKKHPINIEACFSKPNLDIIFEALERCRKSKDIITYQCSCVWENKEIHHLRVQSQSICLEDVSILQSVFYDITEQVETEKNKELYRNVINNAAKAFFSIYIIDLEEDSFRTITQSQSTKKVISSKGKYWESQKLYIETFVHPEDREKLLQKLSISFLKTLKANAAPLEMEYRTLLEDGKYHYTRIQAVSASVDADGFTNVLTVTNTDIDSQKKEEEILREQSLWKTKLNNLVLENSTVRDFCYYPKEDCIIFPERTMQTYGVKEQYTHVMSEFLESYIDAKYVEECRSALVRVMKGNQNDGVEFRLKRSKEWCRVKFYIVQSDIDGTVLNILGIIENLTELKLLDTDKRIMSEMCDYSIRSHYELMLLVDRTNGEYQIFSTASPLYRKIPKTGNYQTAIKKIIKSDFLSEDIDESFFSIDKFVSKLESESATSILETYSCKGFSQEGYWKQIEYSYLPSDKSKIMVLVEDITEAEIRKEKLKEAVEIAESANEAKSAFLANMSHEIRTPMNAIIGMSEILLRKQLEADVRSGLVNIQNASEGLLSIINDILDFSKIEQGKMELIPLKYQLQGLLLDVANLITMRLQKKNIYFFIKVDPSVPQELIGDDIRVKQILINLIGNSVKFTEQGIIEVSVFGSFKDEEQEFYQLEIDIEDTGIGIKKEDMDVLFDKFVQVDTTKNRKVTGTGLGLPISKNMAKAMGGDISVESEYEKGSKFHISLLQKVEHYQPFHSLDVKHLNVLVYLEDEFIIHYIEEVLDSLKIDYTIYRTEDAVSGNYDFTHLITSKDHLSQIQSIVEPMFNKDKIVLLYKRIDLQEYKYIEYIQLPLALFSMQIASVLNGHKVILNNKKKGFDYNEIIPALNARVLIVDDNITNLYVCEELMKPYKMHIDTVDNGYKAIDKAKNNTYDIIFMDQMMPEMDGVETTAKIRKLNSYYEHSIIVALSANALVGAREQFLAQGFDDYLEKPIKMVELNRIIKSYLIMMPCEKENENAGKDMVKQEQYSALIDFDVLKALGVFSNRKDVYDKVLLTFLTDIKDRKKQLVTILNERDIKLFTIYVHAIKSAARSVGAMDLADMSEELEGLGNQNDWTKILIRLDYYMEILSKVINQVDTYFNGFKDNVEREKREKVDKKLLIQLKEICNFMEYEQAKDIIEQLYAYEYPEIIDNKVVEIKRSYDEFDYEKMEKALEALLEETT